MLQEGQLSVDNLPRSKKVPNDAEQLAKWLYVDPQPGLSMASVCLREDVADHAEVGPEGVKVVVRVQGVLLDMNLAVGGTWDG